MHSKVGAEGDLFSIIIIVVINSGALQLDRRDSPWRIRDLIQWGLFVPLITLRAGELLHAS